MSVSSRRDVIVLGFGASVVALTAVGCSGDAAGSALPTDGEKHLATSASALVLGNPATVQLGVDVQLSGSGTSRHDRVVVSTLQAGSRDWQLRDSSQGASPLFEVAAGSCVWNSNDPGATTLDASQSTGSTITAVLGGCPNVPALTVVINLSTTASQQVSLSGTIRSGSLPGTLKNGWFGPFPLGGVAPGGSPVFAADANVAAIRTRVGTLIDPNANPPTEDAPREEAFVIGFDGIFYGSREENDQPWSVPTPLYSTTVAAGFRNIFPSGAALVALRRSDVQADLFAVSAARTVNGVNVPPKVMTVFRYDDQSWSSPTVLGGASLDLNAGAPLAALSLNEEFDTNKNQEEIYVAARDGKIHAYTESNNGGWSQAAIVSPTTFSTCALPSAATTPVNLAALARNHRQRDIFYISTKGALCTSSKVLPNEWVPPGPAAAWSTPVAISPLNMFPTGAPVAAAHGPGNSEYVFAVGNDGAVYATTEVDDGPWSALTSFGVFGSSSTAGASIAAARRTAREVSVAWVQSNGALREARTSDGVWQSAVIGVPALANASSARKIALNLRKPGQLDIFGIGGAGDGRFWTSGDGLGRIDVRVVMPKFLFRDGALAGARGMIPMEMGGDAPLQNIELGMRYASDYPPRAAELAVPQSMNLMELAHVTKDGSSFFVADVSPNIETGRAPAQLTASLGEVDGFWTKELWPGGATANLPSLVVGGYQSDLWQPAVDQYTAYHAATAPLAPAWLRNAGALYTFSPGGAGGIYLDVPLKESVQNERTLDSYAATAGLSFANFDQLLPHMYAEAKALGTNVVYLWDYWSNVDFCASASLDFNGSDIPYWCKGDYVIRAERGGATSLKTGVDLIHADGGGHVILYVEPYVLAHGTAYTNRFGTLLEAHPWPASNINWTPFGRNPIPVSYAHSDWQDRFVQLAVRLIRDTNADGVFLDSGAWRINESAYTKDEGVRASPIEHARGFLNLVDRVRTAIRSVPGHADAVVLSETISGPMTRHIDGAVSGEFAPSLHHGMPPLTEVRATPTRYRSPVTNIFSNGQDLNVLNQVYAAGHNLAVVGGAATFMSGIEPYIKRLVTKRKLYADPLIEGGQTVMGTTPATPDLIARLYTPNAGSRAVVTLVNVGAGDAGATLDISSVGGAGIEFCDIIAMERYYTPDGQQLVVNVPPATPAFPACVPTAAEPCPAHGLRVLVRASCDEELTKE